MAAGQPGDGGRLVSLDARRLSSAFGSLARSRNERCGLRTDSFTAACQSAPAYCTATCLLAAPRASDARVTALLLHASTLAHPFSTPMCHINHWPPNLPAAETHLSHAVQSHPAATQRDPGRARFASYACPLARVGAGSEARRTMDAWMLVASADATAGSVMVKQERMRPSSSGSSQRACCSGVPYRASTCGGRRALPFQGRL